LSIFALHIIKWSMSNDQAVNIALAAFGIEMDLNGLNARLFGNDLVLSLAPPATPQQTAGESCSHIYIPDLGAEYVPPNEETRKLIDRLDLHYRQAGFDFLEGDHCKVMVSPGEELASDCFNPFEKCYTVRDGPYGRRIDILARYCADDRDGVLSAAERVALSVRWL
jgi:hypothetical protein